MTAAHEMEKTHIPAYVLEPEKRAPIKNALPARAPTPEFLKDIEAGRVELPTIPSVVQRLMTALRDPEVDFRVVSKALSRDPVLSAKVLRLANSSMFGSQRSMASIDAAVGLIGVAALNKVIVACGVAAALDAVPGIDLRIFWRDALVAAVVANKLAPAVKADPDEAYTCGLLHATGHLILCRSYPEIAGAMFGGFEILRGAELAAVETEAFGIDHPTVGAMWVESLGFPQTVVDVIGRRLAVADEKLRPLDLALRSGCVLSTAVARTESPETALALLPPKVGARFTDAEGAPDAAFLKFYDALGEIQPIV
ncbi:MAG TPA: HDOD domain-containing protein [Burkholderiaceae bacterium]|jgi:HD-like signal output (HDOD) protein